MAGFQYEGPLETTPLPEILSTIHRHRIPGCLEVEREDVEKHLWIHDGSVIQATSTDRTDRLGAWLYRQELVSREQLEEVAEERERSGRKVGQILIDRDIVTPHALYQALCDQMIAIVRSVFRWSTGRVRFEPGPPPEGMVIRLHLPILQVLLAGVSEMPDASTKELVARLGRKSTVLRPTWSTERLVELALDKEQYALLRRVDGRRSLRQVCEGGPWGMARNARMLYAFRLLGLLEPGESTSGAVMIRMDADRRLDPEG